MVHLTELVAGMPAITRGFGQYLAEAGAVCPESQGHTQGRQLMVNGSYPGSYPVTWPAVTEQMRRCRNDANVGTEHGVVGIAGLLTKESLGYSVVQRARKGNGFDYGQGDDTPLPFQNKARLEISSIRSGDASILRSRVNLKRRQTDPSDGPHPPEHSDFGVQRVVGGDGAEMNQPAELNNMAMDRAELSLLARLSHELLRFK